MKAFRLFTKRGQTAALVAFGIAVFAFWCWGFPHLLMAREQSQLFLCDGAYFLGRLAEPGGLARYVAEGVVQFFFHPAVGALLYALILVAMQWLFLRVLRRCLPAWTERHPTAAFLLAFLPPLGCWALGVHPMASFTFTIAVLLVLLVMALLPKARKSRMAVALLLTPVVYWLTGPAAVLLALPCLWMGAPAVVLLLAACVYGSSWLSPYPLRRLAGGVDYYRTVRQTGSLEDMRYDRMIRLRQWSAIIRESNRKMPQSEAARNVVRVAQFFKGHIGEQELHQCLLHSERVINSQAAAFMMSEVYMQLGMPQMAQRAAFDAMESIPNYNKSARTLYCLVETNLVTGHPEVAGKYLSLLEKTTFYRAWARKMRQYVRQPELLRSHPYYGRMMTVYEQTDDTFFL